MTRAQTSHHFIFCVLSFSALSVTGCQPTRASLNKTIDNLEKQVAQLKTERVNLEARSGALDDKTMVLQKKLDVCRQENAPLLKVVKLSPEQEERESDDEAPQESGETDATATGFPIKSEANRPKLVIQGGYGQDTQAEQFQNPSLSGGGGYFTTDADNLGVVQQANQQTDGTLNAFQAAYLAYSNKKYQEALGQFSQLIQTDPQHEYADNAVFWRGECYLALGDFFKAVGEFERLLRRYPNSETAPSSLYRIGYAYDQLRDRSKAVEYYFRVVDEYPDSDAARRASRRVSAIEGDTKRSGAVTPTAAKR